MWIAFALLAAVCFGIRGILYQWTSQKKIDRNLLLFGVFFIGFVLSAFAMSLFDQKWYGLADIAVGLALGLGSFAANAFLHKGFSVGKASLISILSGLTPLFVLFFAFLLWREKLSSNQLIGFFIIFSGLYIIRYSNDISFSSMKGSQWGLLAALFFAFNDLLGKQSTLLEADTFATLTSMFGCGSVLFSLKWIINRNNNEYSHVWPGVKTFSCGLFIGLSNVVGMVSIISAFSLGNTGLVSAISGMNILIILLYSRLYLKDFFSRNEILGITTALIGVIILRLSI